MSAIIIKLVCSILMSLTGLIVVKNISGSQINKRNIIGNSILILLVLVPIFNYGDKYSYISTLIVYILSIFSYKYILNISFSKSTICSSLLYLSLFLLEFICSQIFVYNMSKSQIREVPYINMFFNSIFCIILLIVFNIKYVKKNLTKLINKIEDRKSVNYIIFFLLIIIAMSIILYTITLNYKANAFFYIGIIVAIIFFILVIILINERNNYEKLYSEYDNLFNYVKVFEDWIEKEQYIRHEYKNQLAIIRYMTKEKKVKNKIDEIISENINIDNNIINQLKGLPNGGFKGLLYYKIAIAKNQKINMEIDISNKVDKLWQNYNKKQIEIISKLVGIYLDNAIEAAKETKKKIVLIEIYDCNKNINIVVSNTFNKNKDISNRNQKGFTTKGKGRGNGLYFASKMLNKNSWIIEEQKIIDNYYIEKLSLCKNKKQLKL